MLLVQLDIKPFDSLRPPRSAPRHARDVDVRYARVPRVVRGPQRIRDASFVPEPCGDTSQPPADVHVLNPPCKKVMSEVINAGNRWVNSSICSFLRLMYCSR